jgi:D-3-phosphoglycerate dehydrogenase
MVTTDFIKNMKSGSALINTARGEIITDLDIFVEPIKSGKLIGVGLNVLPEEPPKNCELIRAWKRRDEWASGKVINKPHTSYYSQDSYVEMRKKAAMNAKRIIKGDIPFNIITS